MPAGGGNRASRRLRPRAARQFTADRWCFPAAASRRQHLSSAAQRVERKRHRCSRSRYLSVAWPVGTVGGPQGSRCVPCFGGQPWAERRARTGGAPADFSARSSNTRRYDSCDSTTRLGGHPRNGYSCYVSTLTSLSDEVLSRRADAIRRERLRRAGRERRCVHCGHGFFARADAIYCTGRCRVAAFRVRTGAIAGRWT